MGRVRAQRRLLRRQPDPRPAQRARALPDRARRRWSGWAGRTSRRSRRRSSGTASTAAGSAPASSTVATAPWQLDDLREMPELARRHGGELELLDAAQVRERVDSPTYLGGLLDRTRCRDGRPGPAGRWPQAGLPAPRRAHLRALGRRLGRRQGRPGSRCTRRTAWYRAAASRSAPTSSRRCCAGCAPTSSRSGTTCWSPSRCPPTSSRRSAGRAARASATPATSSTTTGSHRTTGILWGGYDAIYHFGNKVADRARPRPRDLRPARRALLRDVSRSWTGLRFTHAWGGVIDTCSRFCAFWGRRTAGGWPMPPATPVSAWARRGSGRG